MPALIQSLQDAEGYVRLPAFLAKANGQIKAVGTADNGTRIGCMKQFDGPVKGRYDEIN